jgi:DNA invertase Pin-like site-specific DNA recombinase
MVENGTLKELTVHSIDRLGRSTLDVLTIWEDLTKRGITIICKNPNLRNITEDGKVDKFSELMMGILSTMSQFEKSLIRERQMEGIKIRKEKGLYSGRRIGTVDTKERFLSKPKNKQIIDYLKRDSYSYHEIGKILGCSTTTITKVNKLLQDVG